MKVSVNSNTTIYTRHIVSINNTLAYIYVINFMVYIDFVKKM